jgi:Mn2+/Fe2+ NRAMP family transporter
MNLSLTVIMAAVAVPAALMAATRFPQWHRRRNIRVIGAGLLLSASFGLMIPDIYTALDIAHNNALDIVVKGLLFLSLNIVGADLADANNSHRLARRIYGPLGWAVFAGFMLALAIMLVLIGTEASSPALEAYRGDPLVVWYNTIANAYPAVIGVLLAPHLITTIRNPASSTKRRMHASLVAVGFLLSIIGTLLLPVLAGQTPTYRGDQVINGIAAISVIVGFILAYREMGTQKYNSIRRSALNVD